MTAARLVATHDSDLVSRACNRVLVLKKGKLLADDVPALFLFVMPKLGIWDRKLKGLWENEPIPSNVLTEVYWEE